MNIVCVDDEPLALQRAVSQCGALAQAPNVVGFTRVDQALEWMGDHQAHVALLDIMMPGMNGLELANKMREIDPNVRIVYLTTHAAYAVDAFEQHVSGYLLKPVSQQRLQAEMDHAMRGVTSRPAPPPHVEIRTFGMFELLVDGTAVAFHRSKAKELLAYLVDRQGGSVSRAEVFSVLWNKGTYDRRMQKQLDVIVRSLRSTLDEQGIGEIVSLDAGRLRLHTSLVSCDLYRFLHKDADAMNSFRGEYLPQYEWARVQEGYLALIWQNDRAARAK